MTASWQPRVPLLTLDGRDGQYAVVRCMGGGIGITRDEMPIPECHWPEAQLNQCLDELIRRAGASGLK